jgi:hypothetical protein
VAVADGRTPAGRWVYAAAQRFLRDLERSDIAMDWDAVAALDAHFRRLSLVGEASGDAFELHPWQLWTLAQIVGWRAADGRRRIRLAMVQVARGNGKTTLMAGLALWDLLGGEGRRVHVIANNEDQAGICLDTARTMAMRLEEDGLLVRFNRIVRPSADCEMTALPALERSLDGLNPSLWIADEAAEFKGRFLTKLLTTGAKRRESTGVVITTPGSNPENHYAELVKQGEAILAGEVEDDTVLPILYGLDPSDQLDEEATWPKANPGMEHGQPDLVSLRRSWNTMKRSAMGRAEFSRYHAARMSEDTGGWLDMALWPGGQAVDWEALRGRPAWCGLDLSQVARHDGARRRRPARRRARRAPRPLLVAEGGRRSTGARLPDARPHLGARGKDDPHARPRDRLRSGAHDSARRAGGVRRSRGRLRRLGQPSTSPSSSRRTASRSSSTGWGSRLSVRAATCSRTSGRGRASWSATTPSFAAPAPRRTQRGTRTATSARSSRASIARSTRSSPRSSRAMCGAGTRASCYEEEV